MTGPELLRRAALLYLAAVNLAGFFAMLLDKGIARDNAQRTAKGKRTRRRIPERTLFLIAALGGSAGSWLGMYAFRHKTKHWYFVAGIPAILAAQLLLVWFFYTRFG